MPDRLLKHKQRLRNLWHETRDPTCKREVTWVAKTIRRKALGWWETKISNCEVTPQAILPMAKSLMKRDGGFPPSARVQVYRRELIVHSSQGIPSAGAPPPRITYSEEIVCTWPRRGWNSGSCDTALIFGFYKPRPCWWRGRGRLLVSSEGHDE